MPLRTGFCQRRFLGFANSCRLNNTSTARGLPSTRPQRNLVTRSHTRGLAGASVLKRTSLVTSSVQLQTSRTLCTSDGRSIFSYGNVDYIVYVKTGDQLNSGTDAAVKLVLHAEDGQRSDAVELDYLFRNDFERGQLDTFQLTNIARLGDIHKIELWREDTMLPDEWYVDYIEIESTGSRKRFMFPCFRWIKANKRYIIRHMDNCLPQFETEPHYREQELEEKRSVYQCKMKVPGGPTQVGQTLVSH